MASLTLGAQLLLGSAAGAATLVPEKGGIAGYVNLGGGALDIESNMISTLAGGLVDVGDSVVDDINSAPDSESAPIPTLNFELSYTFEESRTQLYVGNLLEDFLSFDLSALAGIRQDVGGAGILGIALVSTSLSSEVWADPYVIGERRKDTEREAQGYRVTWDRVFGTGLELQYSSKEVDIDDERSGEYLGLSPGQQRLLDRNGDLNQLQLGYEINLSGRRHILTPALVYLDTDLDGAAMAYESYGASLNYIYSHSERWRWVFNLTYQEHDYDSVNPVYSRRDDAQRYGVAATAFYSKPFGWENWSLNATVGYFEEDHEIDFYDASVTALTLGLLYRF